MRMSFIYPWENSPEKEIVSDRIMSPFLALTFVLQGNPLSFELPDISSDMEAIYGEGAAKYFLPSTPTRTNKALPVFLGDSPYENVFVELIGSEPTPESPSWVGSSPASSSGYSSVSPNHPSHELQEIIGI